MRGLWG
jgi:transposase